MPTALIHDGYQLLRLFCASQRRRTSSHPRRSAQGAPAAPPPRSARALCEGAIQK
jgi:hypothetical protein